MVVHQFDVYLVSLDPARGHEMQKTRPCVVITPDSVNRYLQTVLVAPLTSTQKYPFRVSCNFGGRAAHVAIDQIRCVNHGRLINRLGVLDKNAIIGVRANLVKMFS